MPNDFRFWRNVGLIGAAHVALVTGLIRWSHETKPAPSQSVVWLGGGGGDGAAPPVERVKSSEVTPPVPELATASPSDGGEAKDTPSQEASSYANASARQDGAARELASASSADRGPEHEHEVERPMLTSLKSEIQLPVATPTATATVTPVPRPSLATAGPSDGGPTPEVKVPRKPKAKPLPRPTPKPTAKPKTKAKGKESPVPTPKPRRLVLASPRRVRPMAEKMSPTLATASPSKGGPKLKPTPADTEEKKAAKLETAEVATVPEGRGKGTAPGAGGHAGGAGGESQFGWYGSMLHDRFYSEWAQPNTSVTAGSKMSALVKIRIEKDGRVSSFEIARPSGNAAVDDSVNAIGKRVTKVDPLPAGLGNGEYYEVRINFELSGE